eukprot:Nk52_evm1s795 gene=Nk52_evmTU1s795
MMESSAMMATPLTNEGPCPRDGECSSNEWNPHFNYVSSEVNWDSSRCITTICYKIKADCDWCSDEFKKHNHPDDDKTGVNCCRDIKKLYFPAPQHCVNKDTFYTDNGAAPLELVAYGSRKYIIYKGSQAANGDVKTYCIEYYGPIQTVLSTSNDADEVVKIQTSAGYQAFGGYETSYAHTPYYVPHKYGDGCDTKCQNQPVCGDGHKDDGEECDDGNNENNDSCTNSCKKNVCGDGFVNPGVEECDDGNTTGGDG